MGMQKPYSWYRLVHQPQSRGLVNSSYHGEKQNEVNKHDNKWKRGTKYRQTGGTGENTPFAKQSRKKERDNTVQDAILYFSIFNRTFLSGFWMGSNRILMYNEPAMEVVS